MIQVLWHLNLYIPSPSESKVRIFESDCFLFSCLCIPFYPRPSTQFTGYHQIFSLERHPLHSHPRLPNLIQNPHNHPKSIHLFPSYPSHLVLLVGSFRRLDPDLNPVSPTFFVCNPTWRTKRVFSHESVILLGTRHTRSYDSGTGNNLVDRSSSYLFLQELPSNISLLVCSSIQVRLRRV